MLPPGSRIQGKKNSGSRIRIEEFKYFEPERLFLSSRNYDPDLVFFTHPGSGSAILMRIYIACQDEVQVNYLWVHIILAFLLFPLSIFLMRRFSLGRPPSYPSHSSNPEFYPVQCISSILTANSSLRQCCRIESTWIRFIWRRWESD